MFSQTNLAIVYALLAVGLAVTGPASINIAVPVLRSSVKPTASFLGSYVLGLLFGLPACTPLLLPVVAVAA